MITRDQALKLLHDNVGNQNLRRHCYAVEAVMRALARRLHGDEDIWGIAGLLHDADYEKTKTDTQNHTKFVVNWIREIDSHSDIEDAILAHGWGYVEGNPEPKTDMQWALYCCDELTGLIVAVTLVKPDKKLSSVTVDSIMKKFPERAFAAGANREQISQCEGRLHIPVQEFVEIALSAMQSVSQDLGL
jgi:putative nucleotidyltransferase with HDIG domain